MEKYSRNQRVSAITKILMENPNKIINLIYFTELFNAAKSTISEDLVVIKDIMSRLLRVEWRLYQVPQVE